MRHQLGSRTRAFRDAPPIKVVIFAELFESMTKEQGKAYYIDNHKMEVVAKSGIRKVTMEGQMSLVEKGSKWFIIILMPLSPLSNEPRPRPP